ncbi:Phosphoglucosamine mutase [Slackia heliotrinireducens]|uniref:Phosphoglucosamine mutase n=1 Tax=Slackia heliotrinireducens (strain ATCC 29202 / DSM 20476 / NCTC 11029 / RHS 1) TaxID=471855 RepID=C7N0Y3_SLAHD|nr:phosphoglucosamine mutase [Slackia heliotrinireducens]ACV23205.1 phosphoglucosamine mutase [Slackia heliotrinireducens DSM 20476]VEH02301.1 Phosphoglucosamine mutase [Slackia heliotrinireducens]
MARLFGTDGVRGVANTELTCAIAYRLGQAAATFLGSSIVVGRDTRKSGDMLQAAVVAGITSAGGDALLAGVIPTPGVALLVRELRAAGGIVISASHNPPEYNGIKFFDDQGFKLPDDVEDSIQAFVESGGLEANLAEGESMPVGDSVGAAVDVDEACEIYIQHAVDSVTSQGITFEGMHIALDTGHGASSLTSAEALRRLGAQVTVINDDFDGNDINVGCGSTNLGPLKQLMAECGADVGIAHDGDADRVMLMAKDGTDIDGDRVEAVMAVDMKMRGALPQDTVVSTVMTNLGFVRAMHANGIKVIQTKVGDRYVLEAMREGGYAIGGEQSGHMIMLDYNSTGDGLVTACQFLAAVKRSGKTVDEAIKVMERLPQTLVNVRVRDKHLLDDNEPIWASVREAEQAMGDAGRVLVRTSGTEPLVRVMVEAVDKKTAEEKAEAIASVVRAEIG